MKKYGLIFCCLFSVNAMGLLEQNRMCPTKCSMLTWGTEIVKKGISWAKEHPRTAAGLLGGIAVVGIGLYALRAHLHTNPAIQTSPEPNIPAEQPEIILPQKPEQSDPSENLQELDHYTVCFSDPNYDPQKLHDDVRHLLTVNQDIPLTITIDGDVPDNAFSALYNENDKKKPQGRKIHIVLKNAKYIGCNAFNYTTSNGNWPCDVYASYRNSITNISIPNTVVSIGDGAFALCRIEEIHFPNSVTQFGDYVCHGCWELKNVTLPTGLKKIPRACFDICQSLNNVKLPPNVESIEEYAFRECSSLCNITWPNNLTHIGQRAFGACGLNNVTIPESVNQIDYHAFSCCNKLREIQLPSNYTQGEEIFARECFKLTKITIPAKNFAEQRLCFYNQLSALKMLNLTFPDPQNLLSKVVNFLSQLYWQDKSNQADLRKNEQFNPKNITPKLSFCFGLAEAEPKSKDKFQGSIPDSDNLNMFLIVPNQIPLSNQDFSKNITALSQALFPNIDDETYEQNLRNTLSNLTEQAQQTIADKIYEFQKKSQTNSTLNEVNIEELNKQDQCIYALSQLCQNSCAQGQAAYTFIDLVGGQSEIIDQYETNYRNTHALNSSDSAETTIPYFYDLFAARRLAITFRILAGLPWIHLLTPAFVTFYMNHSELAFISACLQCRLFAQQGDKQDYLVECIKTDQVEDFIAAVNQRNIETTCAQEYTNSVLSAGAIQIFNYLRLLSNSDSFWQDIISKNLEQSVVHMILGDNHDLVHQFEETHMDLNGVAQSAAIWAFVFQRYDIMNYLLGNYLDAQSIYTLLRKSNRFPSFDDLSNNDVEILTFMDQSGENIDQKLLNGLKMAEKLKEIRSKQRPLSRSFSSPDLSKDQESASLNRSSSVSNLAKIKA